MKPSCLREGAATLSTEAEGTRVRSLMSKHRASGRGGMLVRRNGLVWKVSAGVILDAIGGEVRRGWRPWSCSLLQAAVRKSRLGDLRRASSQAPEGIQTHRKKTKNRVFRGSRMGRLFCVFERCGRLLPVVYLRQ